MLDVQVHAVLCGTIRQLSYTVQVVRVNSIEYQVEGRIRLSRKTQNFVGFVGPNELTAVHLPSESSRVTQSLSLRQVLLSSSQFCLVSFQILIGSFEFVRSLIHLNLRGATSLCNKSSVSTPATQQDNQQAQNHKNQNRYHGKRSSELQESYITLCSCVPAGLHQIGAEHAYPTGLSQVEETREVA